MRDAHNAFHLAIPTHDLDAAAAFYAGVLGCRVARRYADRITLDFFGDQVVCHLDPEGCAASATLYPRHFGVTFRHRSDLDALLDRLRAQGARFLHEPAVRFAELRESHTTAAIVDPSNNVIEFKHYVDAEMMY